MVVKQGEEMKTPDYLSYERYKKKKDDNPNKKMMIFVTTFFATLLVFTVVAKSLSPNVDVTIGDESETEAKETGLGVKKFIDERLKMIQMDDTSSVATAKKDSKKPNEDEDDGYNDYSNSMDEKVNLPTKHDRYANDDEVVEEPIQPQTAPTARTQPPRPTSKDLSKPFDSPSAKVSKVYVGRYATLEQAKVAQEILMDSGLNITPFVKNTGSYYTLQIGSYSSRAKAEGLASELQRNSFPARIVQE